MPVTRRQSAMSNGSASPTAKAVASSSTPLIPNKHRLLSYDEAVAHVSWTADNDHILQGYRPQLETVRDCIRSAFAYLHNETINIHSHSIGGAFFAALIPLHLLRTHFPFPLFSYGPVDDPTPIPPTLYDKLALTVYLICATACLGLSSWFHTVQCHSKEMCDAAHRGDYIGIVVLIVGSILPGMHYSFHDNIVLQIIYMTAITVAGITSGYIVLSPHHRSHRWHRTLTFIALGLSAVIPVVHVIIAKGLQHSRQSMSLDLVIAGGASYIFGAVLYAARFPEHRWPGRFDYFGSSHQIFHCFVLLGAWCQYAALRGMVWGRAMAVGESLA